MVQGCGRSAHVRVESGLGRGKLRWCRCRRAAAAAGEARAGFLLMLLRIRHGKQH